MFAYYLGSYNPGGGDPIPSSSWTDYRVDAVLNSNVMTNTGARNGIILRWQADSGPINGNQGYHGMVYAVDGNTIGLKILRDFNNNNGQTQDASGTELKSGTFEFSLANNTNYKLSFEAAGTQLTLTFSSMDGSQSFSIVATDSTYSSGAPGLRTYQASNARRTNWDSVVVTSVSAIPEPGMFAMIAGLLALGIVLFRRSR